MADNKDTSKGEEVNKGLSKFARFSGLGLQLAISIYLASLLGKWLDGHHPVEGINFHTVIVLVVTIGTMISVCVQAIRITNRD